MNRSVESRLEARRAVYYDYLLWERNRKFF